MTMVAVDGPAGSGKSTLARQLAARLGYLYLDTGAMYRAITFLALEEGLSLADERALAELTVRAQLTFDESGRIHGCDRDISAEIRSPAVSAAVSEVSAHAAVRALLVAEQRRIAAGRDVVMEGRDIGTVVWPEAEVKIFLTADAAVRARRRRLELEAGGEQVAATEMLAAIVARDAHDSSRAVSPLRKADDAVELDTSPLTIPEVLDAMVAIVAERLRLRA